MFKLYISRTFFPSLTLVFSLTPMQWFFRTRPSSGTGPYHLISNISILWQSWNRFRLFTPFTAMAIAPVEAHYSRDLVGDSHHRQKLLFSSRKRTSLITDYQDWVSMLGLPWWTWPGENGTMNIIFVQNTFHGTNFEIWNGLLNILVEKVERTSWRRVYRSCSFSLGETQVGALKWSTKSVSYLCWVFY